VADAVVVFTGVRGGYGNLIVLEHGKNYQTYYAHLSRFADGLSVGQKILRGEEIGYVGMTGNTTGPHLHFEIRRGHEYFDPLAKQNNMALWNLYPEEHARLLIKMMTLNVTRAGPLPPAALGGTQK
jgi:murein DD-endopeptidase MepM/ murein hydrolase activator NlpD